MRMNFIKKHFPKALLLSAIIFAGCSSSTKAPSTENTSTAPKAKVETQVYGVNLDTVKAGKFDTGKMWTFDNPPVDYFEETYGFRPDEMWLNKVRMSALRFASWCSASFVSEDGLVMTNHHCGRGTVTDVQREGEDLHRDGFYAQTLADERRVPELYVDQLVEIADVTKEVQDAINSGSTDEDKMLNKSRKISEIEDRAKEKGLIGQVITFYKGGKYSLYSFKRYKDVRLVFAPEDQLGFYGGDFDNFTYPRYSLDMTFFRVYDDNGNPLKTENYFKWSPNGAKAGEPVFVVGNPGRTNRLNTVAQLEYARDVQYPAGLSMINGMIDVYKQMLAKHPEKKAEINDRIFGMTNSQKVYIGMIKGLNDPVLMQRKRDFEKNFRDAINAKPELKEKYGKTWDEIEASRNESKKNANKLNAFSMNPFASSEYFIAAKNLISYAEGNKKYQNLEKDSLINEITPDDFDREIAELKLVNQINMIIANLGQNDPLVQKYFGNRKGKDAANYLLGQSNLDDQNGIENFVSKSKEEILNSNDPFINFILETRGQVEEMMASEKALRLKDEVSNQLLGQAIFEVYGTSIPPDATFSLRIADGVVKGYEYNGTIAPHQTTFYGLYDRYHSFGKEYPWWDLPQKWANPPAEFDLEVPMNFVSTNDIIGGNSGSPVINQSAEIVGLAFDGNIESLPGNFIFTTEANRTVNVASQGMMEAIQDLYQAKRLSEELKNGKISEVAPVKVSDEKPVKEPKSKVKANASQN